VIFVRVVQDWEVDAFASFFGMLYLVKLDGKGKTSYGGSLPKEGCLVLNLSIVSWVVMMVFVSLGRAFGGLRFH
jgi:hypothetical protein